MKDLKLSVSVLLFLFISFCTVFGDVIFEDDFETNKGWQLVNTSSKGNWERADPQGTNYQLNVTPGAGYYALVTDGRGESDYYYDVDGGETAIQSPEIQLPSSEGVTISFDYYLGHRSDANSSDYFRVKIKTGSSETVILEELANTGEDRPSSYDNFNTSLNDFAGQTIRVLIEAADNSGTILEASLDELKIECVGCGGGSIPQVYETPNYPSNYPNYVNETETIGKHPDWGCTGYQIQVIGESEDNYDFLYLKQDGQNLCDPIHGDLGTEGVTVVVENDDPVDVTFTSDRSVTEQGFHVEAFASPGCQGPSDFLAHRYRDGTYAGAVTYAHPDDENAAYLIGGWYAHSAPGVLLKVDKSGNIIGKREWNFVDENHFRDMTTVPSGGYILAIQEKIIRISNDFQDEWPAPYELPTSSGFQEGSAICCTYDGGFLIGTSNTRIYKIDFSGVIDPSFNYPDGYIDLDQGEGYVHRILETNDEKKEYVAVLGGWPGGMYISGSDFKVVTFDLSGENVEYHTFSTGSSNLKAGGSYGVQTVDGGFIFTGCAAGRKAFLVKTDRSFNVQFVQEYPEALSGIGVAQGQTGSYFLAGVTNNTSAGTGYDFSMFQIDLYGNVMPGWPQFFPGNKDDGSC